jgi:recombinational DNA repair ATPase RecF
MKLKEFIVREFRSVWDSGPIKVDNQATCLVGKNEAGKTALLTALYRTNPIIPAAAAFDEVYDYPKREVEDYRFAVENGDREEAVVVECSYELEDGDLKAVSSVFGNKTLNGKTFQRETYYGKSHNRFHLATDDSHYRPARYFSENASALWPKVSDSTKSRFEAVFKQLNNLLK